MEAKGSLLSLISTLEDHILAKTFASVFFFFLQFLLFFLYRLQNWLLIEVNFRCFILTSREVSRVYLSPKLCFILQRHSRQYISNRKQTLASFNYNSWRSQILLSWDLRFISFSPIAPLCPLHVATDSMSRYWLRYPGHAWPTQSKAVLLLEKYISSNKITTLISPETLIRGDGN